MTQYNKLVTRQPLDDTSSIRPQSPGDTSKLRRQSIPAPPPLPPPPPPLPPPPQDRPTKSAHDTALAMSAGLISDNLGVCLQVSGSTGGVLAAFNPLPSVRSLIQEVPGARSGRSATSGSALRVLSIESAPHAQTRLAGSFLYRQLGVASLQEYHSYLRFPRLYYACSFGWSAIF